MLGSFRPGLDAVARAVIYALLIVAPLVRGGRPLWATAGLVVLALAAALCWVLGMLRERRVEWRRTALDWPLAALIALVLLQIVIGNHPLAGWALGPPAAAGEPIPTPFLTVGTVAPGVTAGSLSVLLAYAAVYVTVVNVFRRRRHVDAFLRIFLVVGSALALFALADYLTYDLVRWRDGPRRATATFVNADHFGAWMNMMIFLSLGYLLAHGWRSANTSRRPVTLAERANTLARQYAVVVGVAIMTLALLFTLSRGAVLSFITTLVVLLFIAAAIGWARRAVVGAGLLLAIVLAYAAWLGLGPLVARFYEGHTVAHRLGIYAGALRLFTDFPVLGIGLGTYPEIAALHQDARLLIGEHLLNAAHSDWLQLLVETGLPGVAIALYAVVRIARDLIATHLLGRGTCPVDGGEGEWARRHDPFSVGVSLGALGAVISLVVHSLVDFSARMPANGLLAAACLGVATVALHTRFGTEEGFVAARWSAPLRSSAITRGAGAVACALVVVLSLLALRPAVVDTLLERPDAASSRLGRTLLELFGGEPRALVASAKRSADTAYRVWTVGAVAGQPVGSVTDRGREALRLLKTSERNLTSALASIPSSPLAHERLAWTYQLLAQVDTPNAATHAAAAVAHLNRAIALAPEHPFLHRALALLVVNLQPHAPIEVGLSAARNAVERRPDMLPDLVFTYLLLPMTSEQWAAFVPASFEDRVVLANLLDERRLTREAIDIYQKAADVASAADVPLARWLRARTLARTGDHPAALRELGSTMQRYPQHPDLHLAAAESLDALREPAALDMYRNALAKAEDHLRTTKSGTGFVGYRGRLTDVIVRHIGPNGGAPLARYRRALARHLAHRELWRQTLQETETLLTEAPADPTGHFLRGRALEGLGRTDDALQAYQAAVSADGAAVDFRLQLARLLAATNQPFQAINQWSAALSADPGNLEAALGIARTHAQHGSKTDAFRAYQQVLHIAPDNAEARRVLVRFGWIPQ